MMHTNTLQKDSIVYHNNRKKALIPSQNVKTRRSTNKQTTVSQNQPHTYVFLFGQLG